MVDTYGLSLPARLAPQAIGRVALALILILTLIPVSWQTPALVSTSIPAAVERQGVAAEDRPASTLEAATWPSQAAQLVASSADVRRLPAAVLGLPEAVELRTSHTATFRRSGGGYTSVVSTEPLHYLDARGSWQTAEPAFTQTAGGWEVRRNAVRSLAGRDAATLEVAAGSTGLAWQAMGLGATAGDSYTPLAVPAGPATVEPSADGRLLRYAGGWTLAGLSELIASAPGYVEHSLVLDAAPVADVADHLELRATLTLQPGATLWADGVRQAGPFRTAGALSVHDRSGSEALRLEPVIAYEQKRPEVLVPGEYAGRPGDAPGEWILSVRTPWAWWSAADRRYPAVLDPQMRVLTSTGYSSGLAWVNDFTPAGFNFNPSPGYYRFSNRMILGSSGSAAQSNGYVQFNAMPFMPTNNPVQVSAARLEIVPGYQHTPYYELDDGPDYEQLKLQFSTAMWPVQSCLDPSADANCFSLSDNRLADTAFNWNNRPAAPANPDIGTLSLESESSGGKGLPYQWDVTAAVQEWYSTAHPRPAHGPMFGLARTDPSCTVWHSQMDAGAAITVPYQVPRCTRIQVTAGNARLLVDYSAIVLPDQGDNLLNRPGVPSYAEDAAGEEIFAETNHQYQVKTGSGKWIGVAARGDHAAGAPAAVPVQAALKLVDPNGGTLGDGDEGLGITSWVTVDGRNPNAQNRTLTAAVIRDERNNFDRDADRNYRIQYASGTLWTPTDGQPNPPPPGVPDGRWRTSTLFFNSENLLRLVEFDLGAKFSGGIVITPTKLIQGNPVGPALDAVGAALLEPTGGGLTGAVRTPTFQGSDGALTGWHVDATSLSLEFGGQNASGRYAVALVNNAAPFLDATRSGVYQVEIAILACPDGTIPTKRLDCQPIVMPHNALAAPYNFVTPQRMASGVRVQSEGGFVNNGGSWCTTNEKLGTPLIGPLGVFGTQRYVYVAQGSVCYDAASSTLYTTDDSAVGLVYPQSYTQPDGTTRGQRAPSVPLYGVALRYPADPAATGRVSCGSGCSQLVPDATTQRRQLPFAAWGAAYGAGADGIYASGVDAGKAFGRGAFKLGVSVDVQSPPFARQWEASWQLYPSPGAPDPDPATASDFRRYFFNVGLTQDATLPAVMDVASVELRLLDGPDGASTGTVKDHHSTIQSAGPVFRELSAPYAKLTLPPELGGGQPGATKKAQAVILPPGQARRTPSDDPDPVTRYCGDATLSCLELRRPEYAWNNGNGAVLRVDLPDMFIRDTAGTVMVSEAGRLTVWSNDHPDAGALGVAAAGVAAASQEFQFETWGAKVQLSEEACEEGSSAIVTVIRGTAAIALPMLGEDGSNGGPVAPPSVVMNFRLCKTELQYARLELDIAPGYLPVGATGVGVDLLGGEVIIGRAHTTIKLDVGFRSVPSDAVLSNGFGQVTIDTRGLFQVQAQATIVGVVDARLNLAVAWNPLDVLLEAQASAFGLIYGSLKLHAWVGQGWQNKYSWLPNNNDFHFTGSIKGWVHLEEDMILPFVPPDDIDIGVSIAFGEFCQTAACTQYGWGMSAAIVVAGTEVGIYVDDEGPEFFLGSDDHTLIDEFGGGAAMASVEPAAPAAPPPSSLQQLELPGQFQPWLIQQPEPPYLGWPTYGPSDNPDGACDLTSPASSVTCTFNIAANAAGRATFSAGWLNGDLAVTVIRPDGSTVAAGDPGVTLTEDPGPAYRRVTFLVKPPSGTGALPAGAWKLRITGAYLPSGGPGGERHSYSLMFATDPPPPALSWQTPATQVDGTGSIALTWMADRAGAAVPERLELFYTPLAFKPVTDTDVISATLIANGVQASAGSYVWDTSGLASGEYAIAARIDDHLKGNAHVVSWAPGSVVINDTKAPPQPEMLGAQSLPDALAVLWKRDLATKDLAGYLVEYTYPSWDGQNILRTKTVLPRSGSPWPNSPILPEQARIGGLLEGYESEICVRAYDASGNVSPCSPIRKRVDSANERPPGRVRDLAAEMERSPVRLRVNWSGPAASRPAGYWLAYEPVGCLLPGANDPAAEGPSPIDVGNTFTYYLSGLAQGQRYRLTVTSYDTLGVLGPPVSLVARFLDPLDATGDGLPDSWANLFGVTGAGNDPDGDGLTNGQELDQGTYPTKADSDRDGFGDRAEVDAGSDPCGPGRPSGPTGPVLRVTGPAVARFATPSNLAQVTPKRYWIVDTGADALRWEATASEPWITLAISPTMTSPLTAAATGMTVSGDETTALDVGLNVCGLGPGIHRGQVAITNQSADPGAPVETATIDVVAQVLGEKLLVPPAVGISRNGSNIDLAWPPTGADRYEVWQNASDPFFGPQRACVAPGCVTVDGPGYVETAPAVGARYYFVRSASLCGDAGDASNRVGAFSFGLAPGVLP